jgi:hypothetical protein
MEVEYGTAILDQYSILDRPLVSDLQSLVHEGKPLSETLLPRFLKGVAGLVTGLGLSKNSTGFVFLHDSNVVKRRLTLRKLIFPLVFVAHVQVVLNEFAESSSSFDEVLVAKSMLRVNRKTSLEVVQGPFKLSFLKVSKTFSEVNLSLLILLAFLTGLSTLFADTLHQFAILLDGIKNFFF